MRRVSFQSPEAGSGRPRHLVLVRAVAVLDVRLAGPDARAEDVLPELRDGDRFRYPLLLGRPHGDAGRALHGRGAVSRRVPARDGARRKGREDVEDARQRDRPARRHREVRSRRPPLHARVDGGTGPRHQAVHRAHRRIPRIREQDLERRPIRADERRRLRPAREARERLRSLDPQPPPPLYGGDARRPRRIPAQRRGERHLPLHLERAVRLGDRAEQAGALRREDASRARRSAERAPDGAGGRAAAAASVHAFRDRGDLAAPSQPQRHHHHARAFSGSRRPRRGRRAGDGRDLARHRRRALRARRGEPPPEPARDAGPFRQGSRGLREAPARVPAPHQRRRGDAEHF